jgi:hypothetical protein
MNIEFNQDDFGRQMIFIVGNSKCCFASTQNRRIIKINCSLNILDSNLSEDCFLRINYHTIINTKFYVGKQGRKEIMMKDGSVHKVSRQRWNDFK